MTKRGSWWHFPVRDICADTRLRIPQRVYESDQALPLQANESLIREACDLYHVSNQ